MAFTMKLWQIENKGLVEIHRAKLDQEKRLEDWIAEDSSLLGLNVLIIGRQVQTNHGGRIDLLALNDNADVLILELKRDRTPREIVAQVLDYASWARDQSAQDIQEIAQSYLKEPLPVAFERKFETEIPESINNSHSMVIVASEMDDASERIVQYLSTEHEVSINVIFFTFFTKVGAEYIGRSWFLDPEEVMDKAESKKKLPWTGYYFVNVGEGLSRNWQDCVKYGFIAAGGDPKYSDPLRRLNAGDKIFAYLKGAGYAGFGTVKEPAVLAKDFLVEKIPISDLPLAEPNMLHDMNSPAKCEWLVGVKWQKTFARDDAKKFPGVFANQNVVCKLRHPQTLEFLKKEFGLEDSDKPKPSHEQS